METKEFINGIQDATAQMGRLPRDRQSATLAAKVAASYVRILKRHSVRLGLTFAMLLTTGGFLAPKFLDNMATTVPATDGTYSAKANQMINLYFPHQISQVVTAVVIFRHDRGSVLGTDGKGDALSNLTAHVLDAVLTLNGTTGIVKHIDCWTCYNGWPAIQRTLVSMDNTTTLISINYDTTDAGVLLPVIRNGLATIPSGINDELQTLITGLDSVNEASIAGVIANLEYMDSIAFPAALILLGFVLWSSRLMILPVVAIITAALLSFGLLMYPISLVYPVFILASSLMMSLIIAMSIDYSLFILSRYKEEMQGIAAASLPAGIARVEVAVARTLETAGHTVLVSGLTLILAFMGLLLSHDPFMTSMGLGSAVAVLSAMIAALIFIPTCLVSFPSCFDISRARYTVDASELQLEQTFELQDNTSSSMLECNDDQYMQKLRKLTSTRWYQIATWILDHKVMLLLLIISLFLPAVLSLPRMQLARSPLHAVPRGSDAFKGFLHLQKTFGTGMLWPTKLLVVPTAGDTIWSPAVFHRVTSTIEALSKSLPSPPKNIQSIVYSTEVGRIPFATVRAALPEIAAVSVAGSSIMENAASYALCHVTSPEACRLLRLARERFVNSNASAMVVMLEFTGDPFSPEGISWLRTLREVLAQNTSDPEKYYVVGNPSSIIDTIDGVYQSAALVVSCTVVAILVVISVSFGSIVVSMRLLPSIGLTIVWTYGLAILIYQDGWLAFLSLSSLSPPPEGLAAGIGWVLPALCFTILCGLCLDYDIFVLNWVFEFRQQGFSDRDALVLGLSATGHTITIAGCIMLIAFSGLLLSDQILLNQMSFFLIVCVLVDTFIVRTVVVPICMDVLRGLSNWWPKRMPKPNKSIQDLQR